MLCPDVQAASEVAGFRSRDRESRYPAGEYTARLEPRFVAATQTLDIEYVAHQHQQGKGDHHDDVVGREPEAGQGGGRSEEHTSELQSRPHLVCRLLLEKKKKKNENEKRYRK